MSNHLRCSNHLRVIYSINVRKHHTSSSTNINNSHESVISDVGVSNGASVELVMGNVFGVDWMVLGHTSEKITNQGKGVGLKAKQLVVRVVSSGEQFVRHFQIRSVVSQTLLLELNLFLQACPQ